MITDPDFTAHIGPTKQYYDDDHFKHLIGEIDIETTK